MLHLNLMLSVWHLSASVYNLSYFSECQGVPLFSLKSLAQDPSNEIMVLRCVNQFIPLPLPCSAPPRAWNWSCRGHWSSEQFTLPKLVLELVAKSVLVNTQVQPKGSVLAPCVTLVLLADHSCIVKGQRYILYHEVSLKYLDLFCKEDVS
jgi:hypothetical protein